MTAHTFENQQNSDCCSPSVPCPPPSTDETCVGTLNGSITGTVTMEKCCCQIMTRTFILNIGPQSEASLIAYLQSTVNSYENNGYMILGHSIADIGAGWLLGLTVGWQA